MIFVFGTDSYKAYDLDYLINMKSAVAEDISKLKKTLSIPALSWVLSGFTSFLPEGLQKQLSGREPIEIESVPRFKCISNTKEDDFDMWVKKQTHQSVDVMLKEADVHATKFDLITWQNGEYPEELTVDQAYKRLVQSKHLEIKNSKKS